MLPATGAIPRRPDKEMPQLIASRLEDWIRTQVAEAPSDLRVLYIEYNEAPGGISIFMFGYTDLCDFDCEKPDNLEKLCDWNWESSQFLIASTDEMIDAAFEKIRKRNHQWASARRVYFAQHDSDDVRPLFSLRQPRSRRFFYELHQASRGNAISSYRVGVVDERSLLNHDQLVQDLNCCDFALILQRRPKLTDLLHFYRGWMVCSKRVVELVSKFTHSYQVFDARLFRDEAELEPVSGYYVLNLYEKVDCIAEQYILPPRWDNSPTTFNPAKGYKLVPSAIASKDIFRLNHEYFRLLVSQQFRDQWDELELTGASWLKREIEAEQVAT